MKVESMVPMRTDRNGAMFPGRLVALAAAATLFLTPAVAHAANQRVSGSHDKSTAVTLESIPGSTAKRVILSAKAAERLGIGTGKVGEEVVVLKQMVSGLVIPPLEKLPDPKPGGSGVFGGFGRFGVAPTPQQLAPQATSSTAGEVWVLVTLSPAEWDRMAKDKSARLLPLATRNKLEKELWAQPCGMPPIEDMKRSMLWLYYMVPGKDHGLLLKDRIRVELQLLGSNEKQKVVPYSAVYYDGKGNPWVYINGKPFTFERQRITIKRIVGDLAVLSDGPAIGTPVVTIGAALLYGAEIFGK
ncbi:MAG: hypothetical protein KJ990_11680 [Proteobacteria bacterium]|nr:hypothetical protein [Pseudomonadota bacterium]MBU1648934.1 hypothetical protein [Pseudomonadota bacterium]